MSYSVYILFSIKSQKFYKGQTNDLADRFIRRNSGYEKSTSNDMPWELVWFTSKPDRKSAMTLETKLKNLSHDRLVEFMIKYKEGITDKGKVLLAGGMFES